MTWKAELKDYRAYLKGKGVTSYYLTTSGSFLRRLGEAFDPESYLDLTQKQLSEWFSDLREKRKLKEASLKAAASHVKACLRWLNDGETPKSMKNMVIGKSKSRVESKDELVSDGEFERLLKAMSPQKRVILRLLRKSGARPAEVLGLRRGDVAIRKHDGREYAELTFRDTKTDEVRNVPVVDGDTLAELKDYMEFGPQAGYLFPSPIKKDKKGEPTQPLGYQSLWVAMKRTAEKVGIEKRLYPYLLRHTRATELMDSPRATADRLMGWKSGVMWKNYTHLATDDLRDHLFEIEGPATGEMTEEEAKELLTRLILKARTDPSFAEKLGEMLE